MLLQVFIAISLILGDGLYHLIKRIAITLKEMCNKSTKLSNLPVTAEVLGKDIDNLSFKLKLWHCQFVGDKVKYFRHMYLLLIFLKNNLNDGN